MWLDNMRAHLHELWSGQLCGPGMHVGLDTRACGDLIGSTAMKWVGNSLRLSMAHSIFLSFARFSVIMLQPMAPERQRNLASTHPSAHLCRIFCTTRYGWQQQSDLPSRLRHIPSPVEQPANLKGSSLFALLKSSVQPVAMPIRNPVVYFRPIVHFRISHSHTWFFGYHLVI